MAGLVLANPDFVVFWRITFSVCAKVPQLRQEMTMWTVLRNRAWARVSHQVDDLPWRTPVGGVSWMEDHAVFDNGFLECRSSSIYEWVRLRVPEPEEPEVFYKLDEHGQSVPYDGENVAIEAEVSLPNPGGPRISPLFYYPQQQPEHAPNAGHHVSFSETHANGRSNIGWQISGHRLDSDSPLSRGRPGFVLEDWHNWHRLRVRQESAGSMEPREPVVAARCQFRHIVDSVTLSRVQRTPCRHLFLPDETVFYIGAVPDYRKAGILGQIDPTTEMDPENLTRLAGSIRRLVFDPNDSCAGCLG